MTEQSSNQGRSDDWSRGGYIPGDQYSGEQYYGTGASGSSRPGQGMPGQGGSGYGTPGQGGAGAARPAPGTPTTPIWQAAPGQAAPGQGGQAPGAPGQARPGQAGPVPGMAQPPGAPPMGQPAMGAPQDADAKGFLGALFDFSFTSFVTTRIIKVLYVLALIVTSLSALVFTISAFRLGAVSGFLTLVIADPLFIIVVMALWRLVLESFVVRFRIAEDVRALRERGGR